MKAQPASKSFSGPLFTVEEAAERLAVRSSTIRRRILDKRIGYVKVGRNVRIPLDAIEQLIRAGYHEPSRLS